MLEKIDELRQQPERKRKRVALFTSIAITLVIAIIWATTLPARFFKESAKIDEAEQAVKSPSPFSAFKANMAESFNDLKKAFTGGGTQETHEPTTNPTLPPDAVVAESGSGNPTPTPTPEVLITDPE